MKSGASLANVVLIKSQILIMFSESGNITQLSWTLKEKSVMITFGVSDVLVLNDDFRVD